MHTGAACVAGHSCVQGQSGGVPEGGFGCTTNCSSVYVYPAVMQLSQAGLLSPFVLATSMTVACRSAVAKTMPRDAHVPPATLVARSALFAASLLRDPMLGPHGAPVCVLECCIGSASSDAHHCLRYGPVAVGEEECVERLLQAWSVEGRVGACA